MYAETFAPGLPKHLESSTRQCFQLIVAQETQKKATVLMTKLDGLLAAIAETFKVLKTCFISPDSNFVSSNQDHTKWQSDPPMWLPTLPSLWLRGPESTPMKHWKNISPSWASGVLKKLRWFLPSPLLCPDLPHCPYVSSETAKTRTSYGGKLSRSWQPKNRLCFLISVGHVQKSTIQGSHTNTG